MLEIILTDNQCKKKYYLKPIVSQLTQYIIYICIDTHTSDRKFNEKILNNYFLSKIFNFL